jgi:hypothetical protein
VAHGRLFLGIMFVSEGVTFALGVFGERGGAVLQAPLSLVSLLLSFWGVYALLIAIQKPTLTLIEAYRGAWTNLSKYLWLNVLIFFALAAGFLLLIIPGILAAFFFSFAPYVFVWENVGGVEALRRSYRYVRLAPWAIALRLIPVVFLALFGFTGGYIFQDAYGMAGHSFEIIFGVLAGPFLAVYQFFIYDSLRTERIPS